MTSLLIVAHAPLASALKAVAAHTFPEVAGAVQAIDVAPSDTPEQVQARLIALLPSDPGAETLILADVCGGTPCNAAQRVADGRRVRVVAGVNVPMLWRALCYREESLETLITRALGGATQGVLQLACVPPLALQAAPTAIDDQVQHHHQQ